MARWTGCLGSRKRDHGEMPRSNGTTARGDPGLGGQPAAPASAETEWQLSGFLSDTGPAGGPQSSGLVIRAPRAGDSPMPEPNSAA
jgi:hypothetical protein